jgi:hypothetical protein
LGGEPRGGNGVTDVIGIEESDQDIDVEQRTHSVRVLFAQSVYLFVRNQPTPTLEGHKAADSNTFRFSRSAGKRATGKFGQNRPCGSIRLTREALGGLEYIVINFQSGTHSKLLAPNLTHQMLSHQMRMWCPVK